MASKRVCTECGRRFTLTMDDAVEPWSDEVHICYQCQAEAYPTSQRVFDCCNVCGRKLTEQEDKMGMCVNCALE